jgi:hypothetical protein
MGYSRSAEQKPETMSTISFHQMTPRFASRPAAGPFLLRRLLLARPLLP